VRRNLLPGIVTVLVFAPVGARANPEALVPPPEPLPLAWCQTRAKAANPTLAADAAAADAARHRIVPAGALEDPRIGYEASNVPKRELDFDSTPMSGHQLRLAQKLPFPGLLSSREAGARAGATSAASRLDDRQRRVASQVERAWTELGFAQRALEITDRNLELLRQLTQIAEAKYRVGAGLQQDVLRAQVELTGLLQKRLQRVAALRKTEATLAGLLDLPPGSRFPRTEELAQDAALPELETLLTGLEERSPLLRVFASRIEEAEALRRVSVLEGYPDFDLGIGYRVRERSRGDPVHGDDFLLAGVTIRLPVNRSKWRAKVAERAAGLRRAEAEYRAARAELRDALRAAHADLERADSERSLLETGLVPQARQSLESDRSGYQVDKVDFLSLIDSQVSLLDAELGLVRAVADRRAAFAALEAAVGRELR
jgi:outer membrane protein TolC